MHRRSAVSRKLACLLLSPLVPECGRPASTEESVSPAKRLARIGQALTHQIEHAAFRAPWPCGVRAASRTSKLSGQLDPEPGPDAEGRDIWLYSMTKPSPSVRRVLVEEGVAPDGSPSGVYLAQVPSWRSQCQHRCAWDAYLHARGGGAPGSLRSPAPHLGHVLCRVHAHRVYQ